MTTLQRPGVPVGGFTSMGQIHATNPLVFRRNQNAMGIAVELLAPHTPGAPVVDDSGEFVGFVSEFDFLRALEGRTEGFEPSYGRRRHGERSHCRYRGNKH